MPTRSDTLPALIALYLARCRVEGKSPETLRAYGESLQRFARCLAADRAPTACAAIGPEHVIAYLDRFTALAWETRHRYFREVRCFFRWCEAAGFLTETPFRGLRNVPLPRHVVTPFTAAQVQALLAGCDPTTAIGRREHALVLTLLDTGIRCNECVQIDVADCDWEAQRLHIRHGKGRTERVVPFAAECGAALQAYLSSRGARPGPLFVAGRYGRLDPAVRLQPNGLKHCLRRLGHRTGVAKVHAHRFRHTFATWAIEADARELDVQHLLGHASPDMVRRYTASYRSEQAALRHAAFSPADQMLAS